MAYRSSPIKSIQRGTIAVAGAATSNTATISAVVVANSIVTFGQWTSSDNGNAYSLVALAGYMPRVDLTNTTTVTATRGTVGTGHTDTVAYEVIEFYPGAIKSIQTGTIAIGSGATSATATVSAVVTSKSMLLAQGFITTATTSATTAQLFSQLVLTNTTTITATLGASGFANTVGYCLVEFR